MLVLGKESQKKTKLILTPIYVLHTDGKTVFKSEKWTWPWFVIWQSSTNFSIPADPEDHTLVVLISSATLVSVLLQVVTIFTESMTRCYNLSTFQSLVTITTKSKTNLDLKLDHRPIIGHQYVKVLLLLLTLVHLLAPASPSSLFHLSVGEIELARLCGNIVGKDAISRNIWIHRCSREVYRNNDNVRVHSDITWLNRQAAFF